jgi:hypothetical protein
LGRNDLLFDEKIAQPLRHTSVYRSALELAQQCLRLPT